MKDIELMISIYSDSVFLYGTRFQPKLCYTVDAVSVDGKSTGRTRDGSISDFGISDFMLAWI